LLTAGFAASISKTSRQVKEGQARGVNGGHRDVAADLPRGKKFHRKVI